MKPKHAADNSTPGAPGTEHPEPDQTLDEVLQEREEQLAEAQRVAHVGSWEWDITSNVVKWSEELYRLYGLTPREVEVDYESFLALLHPEDKEFVDNIIQKAYQDHQPFAFDHRIIQPDGTVRWLHGRGEVVVSEAGQPTKMRGTAQDITESKQAEDALRRSQTQFASLFDSSPDAIIIADAEGKIFLGNRQATTLFGYDENELPDLQVEDLIPARFKNHRTLRLGYMNNPRVRSMGLDLELFARRKDDSEFPVEIALSPLPSEAGGAVMATIRDVSERRRAADERQRILAALDIAQDGIFMFDPDTLHFFYVNTGAERQTGYSQDELLSMTPLDIKFEFDEPRFRALLEPLLSGERPAHTFETIHRQKDGTDCPVEITLQSATLADGQKALVALARDITERKRLEAQFLQAQKMEGVGRLAGGVAHDFNNLLTVISGTAELAESRLQPGDPLLQEFTEIRRAGARAAALTRQLLTFSRKQILQLQVVNLTTVVTDLQPLLRRLIGEDIALPVVLAEDLASVKVDPGQMEQVIVNLAVNSRDAMPDGGTITIETENVELDDAYCRMHPSVQPGPYVMLAVSDTGVGMDEATRQRLFEPFFTTKAAGKGTGLGLATVHGIVEQSGGSIWVASEIDKGTTFKIYLPTVAETVRERRPTQTDVVARGTETILVVEDDEALRRVAQRVLISAGYNVLVAANGVKALKLLESHEAAVDLMLTDVVMPEMGGPALVERLSGSQTEIKILYTSGYTDDAIARHGVLDEGTNFLAKPYTVQELTLKVRDVLDS